MLSPVTLLLLLLHLIACCCCCCCWLLLLLLVTADLLLLLAPPHHRFRLGDDAPRILNLKAQEGTDPAVPDIYLEADVDWKTDK